MLFTNNALGDFYIARWAVWNNVIVDQKSALKIGDTVSVWGFASAPIQWSYVAFFVLCTIYTTYLEKQYNRQRIEFLKLFLTDLTWYIFLASLQFTQVYLSISASTQIQFLCFNLYPYQKKVSIQFTKSSPIQKMALL